MMPPRSQAEMEHQLKQRWDQVHQGILSLEQAFGNMEDWILQMGGRKAFLHPNLKQWMWHDRIHTEWAFAGCGIDEGVMLTIGSLGGVKKLPQPEVVSPWCVYRQSGQLHGPLRIQELRELLASQQIPADILIWSTCAVEWFSVTDLQAQQNTFANDATSEAQR
jgi:hypothetical protein